ncbi:hypothetical protein ACWIUD_03015 [Helicobacter sp. 23-1044]
MCKDFDSALDSATRAKNIKSQNLARKNPSLRDLTKSNRGNPHYFFVDCFVALASLRAPRNDEVGADSAFCRFCDSCEKYKFAESKLLYNAL